MSFYTSLTGLNAATAQLGVTSNNIANVGTTGFKRSRLDFGDIFATSPLQKASAVIGQGVSIKSVTQEFSQGNIQFSANSLDVAISGDGFFPLKSSDGLQDIYTRNGAFQLDESYAVTNSSGQALMAAAVDSNGKADLDTLQKLIVPRSTTGDAAETTGIQLALNLPADATVISKDFSRADPGSYNLSTAVTVFDQGGNEYLATVYYIKTQVATASEPTNKWQTKVYIGDTKLDEVLIQAEEGGEKLFVNQYGQLAKESNIEASQINMLSSKLFNLDDLSNYVSSTPATAKTTEIPRTTYDWKSGALLADPLTEAAIEAKTIEMGNPVKQYTSFAGLTDGTYTLREFASQDTTSTDYKDLTLTVASGKATISNGTWSTALNPTVSGATTYEPMELGAKSLYQASFDAAGKLSLINKYAGVPMVNALQLFSGTTPSSATQKTAVDNAVTFKIKADKTGNNDTSTPFVNVNLAHLLGSTLTGTEVATEIGYAINKAYGDEQYFNFSELVEDDSANLFNLAIGDSASRLIETSISLKVGDYGITDLAKTSLCCATQAIQATINANLTAAAAAETDPDTKAALEKQVVTVAYDPQLQTFVFRDPDNAPLYLSSAQTSANLLFNLSTAETKVDPETGTFGSTVVPNGDAIIKDVQNQRYGITATFGYDDTKNWFNISSGGTGDTSNIEITNASSLANSFLGIATGSDPANPSNIAEAQSTPTRGVTSSPATLTGNPIGMNVTNKFRVDASNNQFSVTIGEVAGVIKIPPKEDYTMEEFTKTLQARINLLANELGNTVSGVKVEETRNTLGQSLLKFTTGTTGDAAFLRVTANSVWGLDGLSSARGTTSTWMTPKQARNSDGFPLYVNVDGQETTDPGSAVIYDNKWSAVFLDKGELTFDSGGGLEAPKQTIEFKAATIGSSGATLKFGINYDGSTQYSSPFSVMSQKQNGKPEGDLIGLDIGNDGLVSANYSNGSQKNLAKIVLTNFSSPTGLRQIGDSTFLASSKSGTLTMGEAGAAGFGTVRAGATERANVDLTQELIDLITAQRNFQASAKAIETNNTLTQAIINLRS